MKETNNNKKIIYSIVGVLALILVVAGSTYAYFSATVEKDNISGTIADVSNLGVTAKKISDDTSTALIPMDSIDLEKALNSNKGMCLDDQSRGACSVYEIKVTNNSADASVPLYGSMTLTPTPSTDSNIKWVNISVKAKGSDKSIKPTTLGANKTYTTTGPITTKDIAGPGKSKYYYVLIYIENKATTSQSNAVSFQGTVTFNTGNNAQNGVTAEF